MDGESPSDCTRETRVIDFRIIGPDRNWAQSVGCWGLSMEAAPASTEG